jgi:general stress protein 26
MAMTPKDVIQKAIQLVQPGQPAVLATMEPSGYPKMRWMYPAFLSDQDACLYTVTSPDFSKVNDIHKHPEVEWILQSPDYAEVLRLRGKAHVEEAPAIRSHMIDVVGKNLQQFWTLAENSGDTHFLVVATVLEEATFYQPLKAFKETIRF